MREKQSVYESMVMIVQFGLNMIVPILLCTAVGVMFYRKFGHPMVVVFLFMAGAAAGFRNVYQMAKRIYSRDTKRGGQHAEEDK